MTGDGSGMKRPEDWHGGWIAAAWVGTGLLLLVCLQLLGVGGGRGGPSGPGSPTTAFLVAVGSLAFAAVPIYVTQRWLRGRADGDREARG